ncbi:MAG: MBL fold metallo-hydrolase [Sphingobacteriales bacterium]|nr:MBL fold metallo-hydrolase [Sphingobacteriales bacterium]MBI3720615.1 MBL fold metallo-hydrolase [Sphingobacteriales bacterium]
MKLYTIDTGYFKLDGGAMFGVVPKSIWNKLNPADENNLCDWALRCLLIEEGDKLILIDTGNGTKQDAKFWSHYYLHGDDTLDKSLAKYGFTADDVTDVILTHLHFDHCGGAIKIEDGKLVPAFKNATYWSNEKHWNWAVYPNEREKASFLKENILPIQESGQLKFQDTNAADSQIIKEITFSYVSGHTEAMMIPHINYNGKTVVFMADLLPAAAHIPIPYVMGYDMFPLTTMQEKKAFLKEALENDYVLFFEHDPKIECCTLQQTERGIRIKESFKLNELV